MNKSTLHDTTQKYAQQLVKAIDCQLSEKLDKAISEAVMDFAENVDQKQTYEKDLMFLFAAHISRHPDEVSNSELQEIIRTKLCPSSDLLLAYASGGFDKFPEERQHILQHMDECKRCSIYAAGLEEPIQSDFTRDLLAALTAQQGGSISDILDQQLKEEDSK